MQNFTIIESYLKVPPVAYNTVATTRKAAPRFTSPQLLVSHCEGRVYCFAQYAMVQSTDLMSLLKQCIEQGSATYGPPSKIIRPETSY